MENVFDTLSRHFCCSPSAQTAPCFSPGTSSRPAQKPSKTEIHIVKNYIFHCLYRAGETWKRDELSHDHVSSGTATPGKGPLAAAAGLAPQPAVPPALLALPGAHSHPGRRSYRRSHPCTVPQRAAAGPRTEKSPHLTEFRAAKVTVFASSSSRLQPIFHASTGETLLLSQKQKLVFFEQMTFPS